MPLPLPTFRHAYAPLMRRLFTLCCSFADISPRHAVTPCRLRSPRRRCRHYAATPYADIILRFRQQRRRYLFQTRCSMPFLLRLSCLAAIIIVYARYFATARCVTSARALRAMLCYYYAALRRCAAAAAVAAAIERAVLREKREARCDICAARVSEVRQR